MASNVLNKFLVNLLSLITYNTIIIIIIIEDQSCSWQKLLYLHNNYGSTFIFNITSGWGVLVLQLLNICTCIHLANDALQSPANVSCACPAMVRCWHLHATLMEGEAHCGPELPSAVTWMKLSFAIPSSPYQKEHQWAVTMVQYLDGVLGLPTDATHQSWMSQLVPTSTEGLYCVIMTALHKGTLVHPPWTLWQVKFYVFSVQ